MKDKTYEITEEQIKEAHGAACSQWKSKIEQWWPEVFKPKLEVGRWYKSKDLNGLIFCLTKTEEDICIGYGGDQCNSWLVNERITRISSAIPATDKEVEEMLIKEAVKRGYVDGVTVYSALKEMETLKAKYKVEGCINYKKDNNSLHCETVTIFHNGKWAEIIKEEPVKEMTIEQIESKLGHKIKIVNK